MARCGCSGLACGCVITSSDTVTVTGNGSAGDPFVLNAEGGGGGGGSCVVTTIAGVLALQTAGTLDTCTTYIVSDWTTPNALPGPNSLFVHAVAANKLSEDVGVYCSGQVDAILGSYVGPVRGKYLWAGVLPGMYYLESVLGNRVSDLAGGSTIDSIPWNTYLIRENTIDTVTFTGGYAVMSALAAANKLNLSQNKITGGTLDFTGITTVASITDCVMVSPNLILVGPTVVLESCSLASGSKIDLTGKAAGSLTMRRCSIKQDQATVGLSAITFGGDGALVLNDVELLGSNVGYDSDTAATWSNVALTHTTVVVTAGSRGLALAGVSALDSAISQTRTGGPTALDTLTESTLAGAGFSLSGAVNPGMAQFFDKINISTGSVAVVSPAAVSTPVLAVTISAAGILNVQAGGAISYARVAVEGTLNTGAFTHDHVVVDGLFTKTATAANSNTLTNKAFDDFI